MIKSVIADLSTNDRGTKIKHGDPTSSMKLKIELLLTGKKELQGSK